MKKAAEDAALMNAAGYYAAQAPDKLLARIEVLESKVATLEAALARSVK